MTFKYLLGFLEVVVLKKDNQSSPPLISRRLPIEQRQRRHWLRRGTSCGCAFAQGRQLSQELMKLGGKEAAQMAQGLEAVQGLYQTHGTHRTVFLQGSWESCAEDCKTFQTCRESAMNSVFVDQMAIVNMWRMILVWDACGWQSSLWV